MLETHHTTLLRRIARDAFYSRFYLESILSVLSPSFLYLFPSYHCPRCLVFANIFNSYTCKLSVHGSDQYPINSFNKNSEAVIDAFHHSFGTLPLTDMHSIYHSLSSFHPFHNGAIHPRIIPLNDLIHHFPHFNYT